MANAPMSVSHVLYTESSMFLRRTPRVRGRSGSSPPASPRSAAADTFTKYCAYTLRWLFLSQSRQFTPSETCGEQ